MKILENVEVCAKPTKDSKESVVVARINVEQFESWEEAEARLGKEEALRRLNVQHKTTEMNLARQRVTGGPTQKQLLAEAMERILKDPTLLAKAQAAIGDSTAMSALQAEVAEMIKAEYEAKRKADALSLAKELDEE
jgi:hypothetical protein